MFLLSENSYLTCNHTAAENIAKQYGLTQMAQDEFAYESQMKYKSAEEAGTHTF